MEDVGCGLCAAGEEEEDPARDQDTGEPSWWNKRHRTASHRTRTGGTLLTLSVCLLNVLKVEAVCNTSHKPISKPLHVICHLVSYIVSCHLTQPNIRARMLITYPRGYFAGSLS